MVHLRTDNGTEFAGEFQKLPELDADGKREYDPVHVSKSAPGNQQQNGGAEGSWNTILRPTRTMIGHSGLPMSYWPYAVKYAAICSRRKMVEARDFTTHEAYSGKVPNLMRHRPFGSLVITKNLAPDHKLAPKGMMGVYLGLAEGGVHVLLFTTRKVIKARHQDNVYLENFFPFNCDDVQELAKRTMHNWIKEERFGDEAISMLDRVEARFDPYKSTLRTVLHRQVERVPVQEGSEELVEASSGRAGEEDEVVGSSRKSARVRTKTKPDGLYSAANVLFEGHVEPYASEMLKLEEASVSAVALEHGSAFKDDEWGQRFRIQDSDWTVHALTQDAYTFHVKKKDPRVAEADSKEMEGLMKMGSILIMKRDQCPKGVTRLKTWMMRKEKDQVPVDRAENKGGSPQEDDLSMQEEFDRVVGASFGKELDGKFVKSRLILGGHLAPKQSARLTQSPALGTHMVSAMLSLVATFNLTKRIGSDLTQAFPQVELPPEVGNIWADPPPGSQLEKEGKLLLFIRNHYGLTTASRSLWNEHKGWLVDAGFVPSRVSQTLLFFFTRTCFILAACHVDDVSWYSRAGEDWMILNNIFEKYAKRWVCTRNTLDKFLGLNFEYSDQGIFLHAHDFQEKMAAKWGLEGVKCPRTPVAVGKELPYHLEGEADPAIDKLQLLSDTATLGWIASPVRADLLFGVQVARICLQNPQKDTRDFVNRLMRFLVGGEVIWGIKYRYNSTVWNPEEWCGGIPYSLRTQTDASHYNFHQKIGKTAASYIVRDNCGNIVHYGMKWTKNASYSTMESETMALAIGGLKQSAFRSLGEDLKVSNAKDILQCDNKAVVILGESGVPNEASRLVWIRYWILRDLLESGEVKLEHIAGVENDANFMTKTLGRVAFETQRLRIMESRLKKTISKK